MENKQLEKTMEQMGSSIEMVPNYVKIDAPN